MNYFLTPELIELAHLATDQQGRDNYKAALVKRYTEKTHEIAVENDRMDMVEEVLSKFHAGLDKNLDLYISMSRVNA